MSKFISLSIPNFQRYEMKHIIMGLSRGEATDKAGVNNFD